MQGVMVLDLTHFPEPKRTQASELPPCPTLTPTDPIPLLGLGKSPGFWGPSPPAQLGIEPRGLGSQPLLP